MIKQRLCGANLVLVGLFSSVIGCAREPIAPAKPIEDPSALYWQLTLNQQAINLSTVAPYNSFQLVVTPRGLNGAPLDGAVIATFTSGNPRQVLVSPEGLVTGLLAATRIPVIATVTRGNLTHVDTAVVSVTATPPRFPARLSLDPDPADSAKWTWRAPIYYPRARLLVRVFDSAGALIPNLAVRINSSDPLTATYNGLVAPTAALTLRRPGPVMFIATMVANGVPLADTLAYAAGLPLWTGVPVGVVRTEAALSGTVTHRFNPSTMTIGTGGYVHWGHERGQPLYEVTFDDPTNVGEDAVLGPSLGCRGGTSGNITTFGDPTGAEEGATCSRRFSVPGTYRYHSAALNASGTIIVVDESQ